MTDLHCFTVVPHAQPGFLSRLTGRKLKENGFIEIHNLLARRQLEQLNAADVETILSNYEISRAQATPRLQDLYRTAVTYFAADDALSEADRAAMKHLRYVLGLDDHEADEAQNDVLRELYRTRLKGVLDDGFLSDEEKKQLEAIAASFGLPEPLRQTVYKEEVLAAIQQAFNAAVADMRLTDGEEQRLMKMGENLGIKITHDADTEHKLARFRLLVDCIS